MTGLLLAAGVMATQAGCAPGGRARLPALASQGPLTDRTAELGVSCRLSLTASGGQVLPARLQALLWPQLCVRSPDGSISIPAKPFMLLMPGRWRVCMRDHLPPSFSSLLEFQADPDQPEIKVALTPDRRLVELGISHVPDGSYRLLVTHESGVEVDQPGNPSGTHLLLLPPGPCTVSMHASESIQHTNRPEHRFVVGEELGQEWHWQLGG